MPTISKSLAWCRQPLLFLAILGLAACGGGGGGGGVPDSGISFTGNTDPAVITTTNASTLVADVMGYTATSSIVAASIVTADAPPQTPGQAYIARQVSQHLRDVPTQAAVATSEELSGVIAAVTVNETEQCESGSVHISGVLNDYGLGTLTATYDSCSIGDETLNGVSTVRVDAFDRVARLLIDATFSFSTISLSTPDFSLDLSGSMRLETILIGTNAERLSVNMVTRDRISGHMTKAENLVIVDVYDNIFNPTIFSETMDGRVFDSQHGFVDVATIEPLSFSTLGQPFPDSGQLLFIGAGNSSIRCAVVSASAITLELDLNGDDAYEIEDILQWAELAGEAGSDLADSDGDGMHNSWENVNGFDPADSSDANEDPDIDGFTNLEEYRSCTDPLVGTSTPLAVDLSITKTASVNPVTPGANFDYLLTVNNAGPGIASNVQVQDILPTGVTFLSALGNGWNCSELSGTVTCARASLGIGTAATITIRARAPATTGSLSNSASVSSTTVDPNQGNNSATHATEVLPPSADLSITKTASPNPVVVDDSLTYTITVRNNGPNSASEVLVTDALPVNMTFDFATPSQGECNGTSTVSCDLGTLDNGVTATINVAVIPTAEGITENTATVTSGVMDQDLTNNTSTATLTVGISASVIQAEIDAAVDGDTVIVAPGIYIGSINLLGKAIIVRSEQGPEVTIIDGKHADSVVNFASGENSTSVLSGFTLQNGFAMEGGGISIRSSSPTISNNIIMNNTACDGAGIGLSFSSPIIRENIIRNNNKGGCSGGIGGGGIKVGGDSSAQILDNHIVDNSSNEGGGIALFAAGTPTIRNNVISGNVGGGISMYNYSDALIAQNVITGNTGSGISWLVPSGNRGPLLINNTIADNDSAQSSGIFADGYDAQTELINNIIIAKAGQVAVFCGDFNDQNSPVFSFNNVFSPSGTAYGGICVDQTGRDGNISDDPLFVDSSNKDYRLSTASPAIDAGDNTVPDLPGTDIAGNGRVVDGDGNSVAVVDMGAYELIP